MYVVKKTTHHTDNYTCNLQTIKDHHKLITGTVWVQALCIIFSLLAWSSLTLFLGFTSTKGKETS